MNPSILRAYDIRGVYGKDFADADFERIGNAFSAHAGDIAIVGRDCRLSSPALKAAVIRGLAAAGTDAVDVGLVPHGAINFWSFKSRMPLLYVTASHLPPEWNGLKFARHNGSCLGAKENASFRERALSGADSRAEVPGMVEQTPILGEYRKFLRQKLPLMNREMKVLLDCGNGTAGLAAPEAFGDHGCEASALFAEPDGSFPNRASEIKDGALSEAKRLAKDFDMVIAFDGDADRIALVDNKGRLVSPEMTASLIMSELLKEQRGPVVANVECSRLVDKAAEKFGRKVVRTPVGYAFVMDATRRSKACFGVEKSMHFFIPSVMPFDDGIVSGLYAAYVLSKTGQTLADFADSAPGLVSGMRSFELPSDDAKLAVMEGLAKELKKHPGKVSTMDGIRLEFDSGWVLVRPSNTSPMIRVTAEGESRGEFDALMGEYWGLVKESVERAGGRPED